MAEWVGLAQTTIHDYIKGWQDNVVRNRKLLAKMKADGRITFNHHGDLVDWKIQFKQQDIQGVSDTDTLTFARSDLFKTAQLDWRGYAMTDAVTKKEKLMNDGVAAVIKRYSEVTGLMTKSFDARFGPQLYVDGNAAGNEKLIHGIESFMGTAQTTAGTGAITGTPVMNPSDTFAGLSTVLGAYGGIWTGTWPNGQGDTEYDFWSPLILDATSTLATASGGWTASTNFAARGLEATRFGLINTRKNSSKEGMIDVVLYDSLFYRQFLELLQSKERIVINTNRQNTLVGLGFSDTVNFDGAEVTYEFGIPASTGYGFNTNEMELKSMQNELFVAEGPDYDIASSSYRFKLDYYGNLTFNPRMFFKIAAYGSNGA